jgi:hypothetical protein
MFAIWLAKSDGLSLEIVFFNTRTTWVAAVCLYTILGMLAIAPNLLNDIRYPYSYSKYAASYIEQNIPSDSLILTSSSAQMSALSVYLKTTRFMIRKRRKPFTYFVWDNQCELGELYAAETNGEKELTQDIRLSMVSREAMELSNGNADGFYYISVLEFEANDTDPFYQSHIVFRTPEDYESKDNYEILYIPFEDARQLIESESNPE